MQQAATYATVQTAESALPAVEDHLDDVGSKEIEAQDIADIRRIDLFPLSGELLDRGIGALVKELLPSMRSRKRLQEHLVGVGASW
jgi:hypothetical protein